MSELVIRQVTPEITTFSIPFHAFGLIPTGGRSTAIKLADGGVFVLVSSPLDEETKKTIDALGPVHYLLTPDFVHTLHISAYHQAYPTAKCIGPAGIKGKKPDVAWTAVLGEGGEDVVLGLETEIKFQFFPGHRSLEIATLHIPTHTLLVADLIFNLPPTEQFSKSKKKADPPAPLKLLAKLQTVKVGWLFTKLAAKDKVSMKQSATSVNSWDFTRIIPCHGDVIETGGKEVWGKVFKGFV